MVALALSIAAILSGIVFYYQLRHVLLAALCLLPMAAAAAVALALPRAGASAGFAALFGMAAALALGERIVRAVASGTAPRRAVGQANRAVALALGPVLLAALLSFAVFAAAEAAASFAASFATAFAASWLACIFPYTEDFIARANAARERRERMLERAVSAIAPRWAFSIFGIAAVLATVAGFGIRAGTVVFDGIAPWLGAVAILFLTGFAAALRDGRAALGALLAVSFAVLFLTWSQARLPEALPFDTLTAIGGAALAAVPLALIGARAREAMREGDDLASALTQGLRENGFVAVALALIAAAPVPVFALASLFASLLLFPAATVALHTLFPRRISLEEAFRR
ncbi:MAG TPA: hypothetical protein VG889_12695 [Rhizomicrobium sp.]|nr:hypothetical protein [Rhizomicrobium sp.]